MSTRKTTTGYRVTLDIDQWQDNGWIYRVGVYEPENYINENNGEHDLIHRNYVDGQGGYFEPEEALNSLPEYAGEIIKESESERFEEFERC